MHKQAVFDHLVGRWRDLFNISYDLLLYDLTSTYFEADPPFPEGDKRRFGYCETAGLSAYSPGAHCRDRLFAGGKWIRTVGPAAKNGSPRPRKVPHLTPMRPSSRTPPSQGGRHGAIARR